MLEKETESQYQKMERPPVLTDISKTETLHKTTTNKENAFWKAHNRILFNHEEE